MPKRTEKFEQMLKLYREENLSLMQIGKRFGISRQAVHERFKRQGIEIKRYNKIKKTIDRETLKQLYETERLTIGWVSKKLGVSFNKVSLELKRLQIKKRENGEHRRKYPEFWRMKVGESVIIEHPKLKRPYAGIYDKAKKAGIKISIKTIDSEKMRITCVDIRN